MFSGEFGEKKAEGEEMYSAAENVRNRRVQDREEIASGGGGGGGEEEYLSSLSLALLRGGWVSPTPLPS